MTKNGACTGMSTVEALAAYQRNKAKSLTAWDSPAAAQADVILIGGTLKACLVEKTCAAWADVVETQMQMTYDASDFPLKKCSDFKEENKCVGSCLWSDSECKSKKSVIASNFPSFGADCPLHKIMLMQGTTSETDDGKFSIWSSQKKCEQTYGESACTQSTTCKWTPPSNETDCDGKGKKSVSEKGGHCRLMDKTETDAAAKLQMWQSYVGTSWNSQMMDMSDTCQQITDESSCKSVEMSKSEEKIFLSSASASGTMGLGVSGGSSFWSACACMAALLPFAA